MWTFNAVCVSTQTSHTHTHPIFRLLIWFRYTPHVYVQCLVFLGFLPFLARLMSDSGSVFFCGVLWDQSLSASIRRPRLRLLLLLLLLYCKDNTHHTANVRQNRAARISCHSRWWGVLCSKLGCTIYFMIGAWNIVGIVSTMSSNGS